MMHITKQSAGWTVIDDAGTVKLVSPVDRKPMHLPTRAEVVNQCRASGLYEARDGNPGGFPKGTLLELSIKTPSVAACC